MSGEEHVYGLDGIREGDNKFPKWLLVVYLTLAIWAVYYTVTYWTDPKVDPLRKEVLNSSITFNNPREEGYVASSKETPRPATEVKAGGNDEKLLAEGKEIYEANCAGCHGVAGDGAGPAAAALTPKPRNFVAWELKYGSDDASITKTLENGVAGTAMPPWKATLNNDQMKAVIAYIRKFKQ